MPAVQQKEVEERVEEKKVESGSRKRAYCPRAWAPWSMLGPVYLLLLLLLLIWPRATHANHPRPLPDTTRDANLIAMSTVLENGDVS